MLETIAIILWSVFLIYFTWYFTSAKHYFPITHQEAKILWKIHKQIIHCKSTKWRKIKRGNTIIGFACECGYKYIQKRPLIINPPTFKTKTDVSMLEKLHTSYNST